MEYKINSIQLYVVVRVGSGTIVESPLVSVLIPGAVSDKEDKESKKFKWNAITFRKGD